MPAPRATAEGSRSRTGVQPPGMGGPNSEPGSKGICKVDGHLRQQRPPRLENAFFFSKIQLLNPSI